MNALPGRRSCLGGLLLVALLCLAGCPCSDDLPCPSGNTNENDANSNDNTDNRNGNGNTNDNADNGNDNVGGCRSEPQTTANPAANAAFLGGNERHALLVQIETVPAAVGVVDQRSAATLNFAELIGTPIPVPADIAYSLVGNGDSVTWVDEFYDIYAVDVGDISPTAYYNGAPLSIERIADVSPNWIVFYVQGSDAIQVIDRRDGAHRILSGAPAGSEWWPQRIWDDELIRLQPVAGQPTDAPTVTTGEVAAVSLLTGGMRLVAPTESISLLPQSLPLDGDWFYWKQVAPDGLTHQVMRVNLNSGVPETLLEQAQNSQDPAVADVLVLIDATIDHLFVQRLRRFEESHPGGGGIRATREFGYFEYRDLAGGVTRLLDYDFTTGPWGTTGVPPVGARLFGERVVWRDGAIGDYAVMDPPTGEVCRVDPFAE